MYYTYYCKCDKYIRVWCSRVGMVVLASLFLSTSDVGSTEDASNLSFEMTEADL